MNLLETKYLSTDSEYKTVDLAAELEFLTMDVISDIAFGEPFGFIKNDKDIFGYVDNLRQAFPIIMLTTAIEPLRDFLHSPLFRGFMPSSTDHVGFGRILGLVVLAIFPVISCGQRTQSCVESGPADSKGGCRVAKSVVAKRFGPDKIVQKDMLGSFVAHGLTQEEAESESVLQV